jgi:phosphopantothenoylcysteine decarboxylase/phosphopantothenate--cysteine ligase
MIVAPCTANTLSKMVHGMCDNLVIATYMSAKCPVFIAPAMDLICMHILPQRKILNCRKLRAYIIPAESGELASGLIGQGRMAEPETILKKLKNFLIRIKKTLEGKTVLLQQDLLMKPLIL